MVGGFLGIAVPLKIGDNVVPELGLGLLAALMVAWTVFVLVKRPARSADQAGSRGARTAAALRVLRSATAPATAAMSTNARSGAAYLVIQNSVGNLLEPVEPGLVHEAQAQRSAAAATATRAPCQRLRSGRSKPATRRASRSAASKASGEGRAPTPNQDEESEDHR